MEFKDLSFSGSSIDSFMSAGRRVERIRVADVTSLASHGVTAGDPLIHIAQNDFWKLGHDAEGFFIERLVDDNSGPVGG